MCDPIAWHNSLSPIITKLELLSRLSPVLETDRDYVECLGTIVAMMGDYTGQLRRSLDALVESAGDSQEEGGRP